MAGDAAAALAADVAWAIVRGEPFEHELVERAERVFGCDAGSAVGRYDLTERSTSSLVVAGAAVPSEAEVRLRRRSAPLHPGWSILARPSSPGVVRLSDLVDLRSFWGTEPYRIFHERDGGRYPANALLVSDARQVVFLAVQRSRRDFTLADMDRLHLVQRVVSAASAFRSALDEAVGRPGAPAGAVDDRLTSGGADHGVGVRYQPTRREAEVLSLAARGWTNRRIAGVLGITERTVRKHLSAVYDKSRTGSRAAATAWWERGRGANR